MSFYNFYLIKNQRKHAGFSSLNILPLLWGEKKKKQNRKFHASVPSSAFTLPKVHRHSADKVDGGERRVFSPEWTRVWLIWNIPSASVTMIIVWGGVDKVHRNSCTWHCMSPSARAQCPPWGRLTLWVTHILWDSRSPFLWAFLRPTQHLCDPDCSTVEDMINIPWRFQTPSSGSFLPSIFSSWAKNLIYNKIRSPRNSSSMKHPTLLPMDLLNGCVLLFPWSRVPSPRQGSYKT